MKVFPWQPGQRIRQRWEVCRPLAGARPSAVCFDHLAGRPVVFTILGEDEASWRAAAQLAPWVELPAHANVCRALNYERLDGLTVLKTDYHPGGHLGRWCRRPTRVVDELARRLDWLLGIARAMEHAASHGIGPHGALCPAHCLLSADQRIKLTPSAPAPGSSTALDREGASGPFLEPRHAIFLAPELIADHSPPTTAGDIYALGALAVMLLAGRQLPDDQVLHEPGALRRLLSEPEMDIPAAQLWGQCLSPWPEERPESFAALQPRIIAVYEHLTGRRPDSPPRAEALTALQWLEMGQGLVDLGRFTEAHPCFDQARELSPGSVHIAFTRAMALIGDRRADAAISALEQVLEMDDGHQQARHELAVLLLRRPAGRARALELLRQADDAGHKPSAAALAQFSGNESDPAMPYRLEDGIEEVLLRGEKLLKADQAQPARICFDRALALDAHDTRAWLGKARSMRLLGSAQQALLCLNMIHSLQPDSAEAYALKAAIHRDLGEHPQALHCFEQALRLGDSAILRQIDPQSMAPTGI
ncbi:MAG: tetratricopeptide repeat protein [Phycisphaeraceae bacterium]|nr:tetratricopeptide repeat protein [Phycisphaeraceae bacterium]